MNVIVLNTCHNGESNGLTALTFPPTSGRMCIFPVRLSLTEATIRQVPQRMTCRSDHLCSCDLPFRTLKTPFSRVRSCWSAFTGCSGWTESTQGGQRSSAYVYLMHTNLTHPMMIRFSWLLDLLVTGQHEFNSGLVSVLIVSIPRPDLRSTVGMDTAQLSHIPHI